VSTGSEAFPWEKGSAGLASSKPWGQMFRLPLSAVGRGELSRYDGTAFPSAGHSGEGKAGLGPAGARSESGIKPLAKPRFLFRFLPWRFAPVRVRW
jgi:hypothetical protein